MIEDIISSTKTKVLLFALIARFDPSSLPDHPLPSLQYLFDSDSGPLTEDPMQVICYSTVANLYQMQAPEDRIY